MSPQTEPQTEPNVPARISASLILAATLTLGVVAAIGLPSVAKGTAKTAAVPANVRVVDAPQRKEGCAEQTWPYIEARCLTRAADKASPPASKPEPAAPISPIIATAPVAPTPAQSAAIEPAAASPVSPRVADSHPMPPALPVPPGAELRPAGERLASAPVADAAVAALAAGATIGAAEAMKNRPRAERRRSTSQSRRGLRLFGFRF